MPSLIGNATVVSCARIAILLVALATGLPLEACSKHGPNNGANNQGGGVSPDVLDGWTFSDAANAMDGKVYGSTKTFVQDEQNSQIEVAITCLPNSKRLTIKLSSYVNKQDADGTYGANPFETTELGAPIGRVKIAGHDPRPLSKAWQQAYTNVMSYVVPSVVFFGHGYAGAFDGGLGEDLAQDLPIVLEVQNAGGTIQFTIPAHNAAIDTVIRHCSTSTASVAAIDQTKPSVSAAPSTPSTAPVQTPDLNSAAVSNGGPQPNPEGSYGTGERRTSDECKSPKVTKGMAYSDARSAILVSGFKPEPQTSLSEDDYCALRENVSICKKFPEIESCSVDGYCRMNFIDATGDKFSVVTFGDGPDDPAEVVNGFEMECKR